MSWPVCSSSIHAVPRASCPGPRPLPAGVGEAWTRPGGGRAWEKAWLPLRPLGRSFRQLCNPWLVWALRGMFHVWNKGIVNALLYPWLRNNWCPVAQLPPRPPQTPQNGGRETDSSPLRSCLRSSGWEAALHSCPELSCCADWKRVRGRRGQPRPRANGGAVALPQDRAPHPRPPPRPCISVLSPAGGGASGP